MPNYGPADPEFAPEHVPQVPRAPFDWPRFLRPTGAVASLALATAVAATFVFGYDAGDLPAAFVITGIALLGFAMVLFIGNETWFAGGLPYLSVSLMTQPVPVDPMARRLKSIVAAAALLPLGLGIALAVLL